MEKHSLFSRLGGLPVPILPTMVGAITLGNMWSSLGFTWIRHLTMWAGILLLLAYILKIIFFFDLVKNEYRTTVPASLYAGFTMLLMLLGSYVFDLSPVIGKAMWALGLGLHTIHLLVFIYSHVFRKFEQATFVPSWFVTFNGIMVSTVIGVPMNEPGIGKIVVYYGFLALVILFPLMVIRLIKNPITSGPLFMTKAILLAPISLCLVSYLNFIPTPMPWVVYVLYALLFATLIYVLMNLVKFFSFTFHPGFAGLTFPMAIGIVASNKMSGFLASQGYEGFSEMIRQLSGIQLYITTALVCYVVFNFFLLLFKKPSAS